MLYVGLDQKLLGGKAPWTLRHSKADNDSLTPKDQAKPIEYPRPDGEISFDLASSVYLSNTNHEEAQPVHLTLKDASVPTRGNLRSEEHTYEPQSLMRTSYAVFSLKNKHTQHI